MAQFQAVLGSGRGQTAPSVFWLLLSRGQSQAPAARVVAALWKGPNEPASASSESVHEAALGTVHVLCLRPLKQIQRTATVAWCPAEEPSSEKTLRPNLFGAARILHAISCIFIFCTKCFLRQPQPCWRLEAARTQQHRLLAVLLWRTQTKACYTADR